VQTALWWKGQWVTSRSASGFWRRRPMSTVVSFDAGELETKVKAM